MRIMALAQKNRGHALAPLRTSPHRDAQLVFDQYLPRSGIEPFDVGKPVPCEYRSAHDYRTPSRAPPLDLSRLEHGVSVLQVNYENSEQRRVRRSETE
jgi:hypothetical protein